MFPCCLYLSSSFLSNFLSFFLYVCLSVLSFIPLTCLTNGVGGDGEPYAIAVTVTPQYSNARVGECVARQTGVGHQVTIHPFTSGARSVGNARGRAA